MDGGVAAGFSHLAARESGQTMSRVARKLQAFPSKQGVFFPAHFRRSKRRWSTGDSNAVSTSTSKAFSRNAGFRRVNMDTRDVVLSSPSAQASVAQTRAAEGPQSA
jgi:hypothetical protein